MGVCNCRRGALRLSEREGLRDLGTLVSEGVPQPLWHAVKVGGLTL